jgi:membrane-associated protease RseP (regulator of RpoE activity)
MSGVAESESYLMPSIAFLQEKGFATGEIGSGVIVRTVSPNSLAEEIGLGIGDIILAVNGEEANVENLTTLLSKGVYGKNGLSVIDYDLKEETILPFSCGEDCKLGISIEPNSTLEIQPIKF